MQTTREDLRRTFAALWPKPPHDGDIDLLLERRPNATRSDWARVLKDVRAESDKSYLPSPKTVLAAMPAPKETCRVCGGRHGIEAVQFLIDRVEAERAGVDYRDYRRLASGGDVAVSCVDAKRLAAQALQIRRLVFFAACDACAAPDSTTIGECFASDGARVGYVADAGMGPGGNGPARESSVEIITRVLQHRRGASPGGELFGRRLSKEEFAAKEAEREV